MNIVPCWDMYTDTHKLVFLDISTRDNIHQYQCNSALLLAYLEIKNKISEHLLLSVYLEEMNRISVEYV